MRMKFNIRTRRNEKSRHQQINICIVGISEPAQVSTFPFTSVSNSNVYTVLLSLLSGTSTFKLWCDVFRGFQAKVAAERIVCFKHRLLHNTTSRSRTWEP